MREYKKYKVWDCQLVVPYDTNLPDGFDSAPRNAVQSIIELHDIPIVAIFSGWGGKLTKLQETVITERDINGCN